MKKYILTLCLALIGLSMMAQNITVSGVVTSKTDGEPLIGATVRVKGTNQGTATDIDGNYTLPNVAKNATLIFNYVGFAELSLPVGGQTTVNAALTETTSALDELVVVGYGVAKKSDLTSSISTIKGGEINEMVAGNAMDALQGRVPGVQVASGGGPGTTPKVMIRGVTSVNGSNPLYVVDGVPLNTSNINFINNNDIESMEVLKDASASAIYGTRASNGVIIITTKKGKSGQTHVDFSASVGWQHISKPSIAGANEYSDFKNAGARAMMKKYMAAKKNLDEKSANLSDLRREYYDTPVEATATKIRRLEADTERDRVNVDKLRSEVYRAEVQ